MTDSPGFDLAAAHRYFAADCFNRAWDLIDKSQRTPEEARLMEALSHSSIFHWLSRADCTPENLSVGYWQASRIQALLGNAAEARRHAETCLDYSPTLEPFYIGYAYEALARAESLAGETGKAKEHLESAQSYAARIASEEHRGMLLKDLESMRARI
jgi:tetratricopeptide (TPR) repeat protein